MKIGFDAKRALNNSTGLGNHARILLNALHEHYPQNEYHLYSPKAEDNLFHQLQGDFHLHFPQTLWHKAMPALWRSSGMVSDLRKQRLDIYHGLSNEIPHDIHRAVKACVVTIHDLIFLKHQEQYPLIDRTIYRYKTKYAAQHAHKIITVSNQSKADLIYYYRVPVEKIEVIYPAVDVLFESPATAEQIQAIRNKYSLPEKYVLHVGSFYPRKNQLTLVRAFHQIMHQTDANLVLAGNGGFMLPQVKQQISSLNIEGRVHLLTNITNAEMPALYAAASVFVFPSLYEGFGAPVLEALWQRVPVITTANSAMSEAAGNYSLFVQPNDVEDMAEKMLQVLSNTTLQNEMKEYGLVHAQTMSARKFAESTMKVYQQLTLS